MLFHGIVSGGTVESGAVTVVIPTAMGGAVHLYVRVRAREIAGGAVLGRITNVAHDIYIG